MTTNPIRILIADDHPVVRDGLAAMLSTQPDFAVVGEAATGTAAVARASALVPDVILIDLEMPELDGVEVIRQLREVCPTTRAIVFTVFDTDDRIVTAVQAGARGYLLKGAPRAELFNAIRVVSQGGSLLQPIIASRLIQQADKSIALTERETQVLELLARGKSNKEIANRLVITERTVKFHVSSIMSKLGANNRTEAVTVAVQRGLVSLAQDRSDAE